MFYQDLALLPELLLLGLKYFLPGLNSWNKFFAFTCAVIIFAHYFCEWSLHHVNLTWLIELCKELISIELQLLFFISKDFLSFNDFFLLVIEVSLAEFDLALAEEHFTTECVKSRSRDSEFFFQLDVFIFDLL